MTVRHGGHARPLAERAAGAVPLATTAVLAWGALAFGAPYPWAFVPLAVAAGLVGAVAVATRVAPLPRLTLIGLALVGTAAVLQTLPLPSAVAEAASPAGETVLLRYDLAYALAHDAHPARALSISPARTRRAIGLLAAFSLLLAGTACLARREHVRALAWGVTGLGVALALVALVQRGVGAERIYGVWTPEMSTSFYGPFVNKNHFAGWMLMAIPFGLGLLGATLARSLRDGTRSVRQRVLWLATAQANQLVLLAFALVAMTLSLVLTLSRSGIAALAAALAVSATLALRHASVTRRVIGAGSVAAVGVTAVVWAGTDSILRHFAYANVASFNNRLPIWRDTLRIVHDFWRTGTGLNTYGVATLVYQTTLPSVHVAEAHNDYLQLAAEGGLLLGVPVVCAVLLFIGEVSRRMRPGDGSTYWLRLGAITGILAVALQSTVEFALQMPANAALFAVLCGIALRPADAAPVPNR